MIRTLKKLPGGVVSGIKGLFRWIVGRFIAAGCFLPLTQKIDVDKDIGTRHRAAIGVTEEYDHLAIIVSEETGRARPSGFGDHCPNSLNTLSEYPSMSSRGIPAMSTAWSYMISAISFALSMSSA